MARLKGTRVERTFLRLSVPLVLMPSAKTSSCCFSYESSLLGSNAAIPNCVYEGWVLNKAGFIVVTMRLICAMRCSISTMVS